MDLFFLGFLINTNCLAKSSIYSEAISILHFCSAFSSTFIHEPFLWTFFPSLGDPMLIDLNLQCNRLLHEDGNLDPRTQPSSWKQVERASWHRARTGKYQIIWDSNWRMGQRDGLRWNSQAGAIESSQRSSTGGSHSGDSSVVCRAIETGSIWRKPGATKGWWLDRF